MGQNYDCTGVTLQLLRATDRCRYFRCWGFPVIVVKLVVVDTLDAGAFSGNMSSYPLNRLPLVPVYDNRVNIITVP